MQTIPLYRYIRPDGGVTVSPMQPEGEYSPMLRLVAEDGMALTKDGVTFCSVIDVESAEGWYETAMPDETLPEEP